MKLRKSQKIMLGIMGVFLAIGVISVSLYAGINDPNQENSLNPCPGPGTGNCVYENCPEAGETREESDICSGCDTGTPLEVTSGVNGQIAVWLGDAPQYSIDVSDIDRVLDGYKMRTGTVNIQCKVDWGPWSACDGTWIDIPGDYIVNKWSPLVNTSNDQVAWVDDVPGTVTSMTTACIGSVEVKAHVVDTGSGCYVDNPDDATPLTVNIASVDVEAVSANNQYGNEDTTDCGDELPSPHETNPGIIIPLDREDDDNDGILDVAGDPNPTTYYSQVKLRGSGIPDGSVRITGAKIDFWDDWEATAPSPCVWSAAELPVDVYFRGTEHSITVGDGQAVVTGGGSATDTVKITIVDIDLQMQAMPETGDDNEITTGGIVGLNNDDDNDNDTKDSEDPYDASDNDFVPMTLSFFPQDLTKGVITFTITSGAEHVRVFRKQGDAWILVDGSYEFILSNEHPPFDFRVDGKSLSDAKGVSFEAEYYAQDGQVRTTDVVKCTVMAPDIIVNNVEEEHEVDVGAYIMVNDADTNNKRVYDEDAPGTATQDIRPMVLKFPELDTGTMTLSGGAGNVKIWKDKSKGTGNEVTLPKTWDLSASTEREYTYYIEGRSASGAVRDVSFDLQYAGEKITLEDIAAVTVVQIDLHGSLHYPVVGGEPAIELKEEEDTGQLPDESDVGMYIQYSEAGDNAHNSRIYIDVEPANLDHGTLTLTDSANRLQFVNLSQTQWQLPNKPTSNYIGVKGAAASASVKDTTIALTYNYAPQEAGYGDAISRSDEINATVVRVDVEMQGRTEADEETKGALVPQRWLILEPTGTKPAVAATLRVLPADLPAANAVIDFNSNLGMATDADDQNHVANGTQWNLNQLPQTVYALGNSADQVVRGSHVKLTGHFTPPGGSQIELSDEVKVTIFNLDLVAANLSESQEMEPGAIIRLNNDNDNDNTVADRNETPVGGENDLVELKLNVTPATLDLGTVTVSGPGDTLTRLWNDQTKTSQPSTLTWQPANAKPASLWMEGYDLSTYDRTAQPPEQPDVQRKLSLEYEPGKKAVDQINATVGVIDLHFYRGEGPHSPFDEDAEELIEENAPGLFIDVPDTALDMDGNGYPDIEDGYVIESDYDEVLDTSGLRLGHLHLVSLKSLPSGTVKLKRIATESTGDIRVYLRYAEYNEAEQRMEVAVRVMDEDDEESGDLRSYLVESGAPEMLDPIEDGVFLGIEGVTPGHVVLEATYTEPGTGQKMTDKVVITVASVDLDIDSDNDNGLASFQRSEDEDKIEDLITKSGKYIMVNNNDDDDDGVLDYVDGFDWYLWNPDDDQPSVTEAFTPLVLELPETVDMSKAKIRFTYSASDPADTEDYYGVAVPADGDMRIWIEPGSSFRFLDSVADGGDFVPPATEFDVTDLRFSESTPHVKTLYIEGIWPSASSSGGSRILAEVDPDGDGPIGFVLVDAVRATIVEVNLKAQDVYDDEEYTYGAVVGRNTDNDDFNANPANLNYDQDCDQNTIPGEDDLKELQIEVWPKDIKDGELWLEISQGTAGAGPNDTRIKVWEKATKDGSVITDGANKIKKWNMSSVDFTKQIKYYVEGCQRSAAPKDAELTLAFHPNPANDVPMNDKIRYTVVELILDVDRNNAITNDNQFFRPGYDTATAVEGNPVITDANNWRQELQLIAAPFNLGAEEYPIADKVTFKIVETTAFRGVAMNRGNQTENDFSFSDATNSTTHDVASVTNNQVRQEFYCKDYGGRAKIEIEVYRGATKLTVCELRIPLDADRDLLPDFFETQYAHDDVRGGYGTTVNVFDPRNPNTVAVAAMTVIGHTAGVPSVAATPSSQWDGESQASPNPPDTASRPGGADGGGPAQGLTGDGLTAFEEYRGFTCEGTHRRTSPFHKDLFAHSTVTDGGVDLGLGFLPSLNAANIDVHRIGNDDWTGVTSRIINRNRDATGMSLPSWQTDQRALRIVDGVLGMFGLSMPGNINTGNNGVCETTAAAGDTQPIAIRQGLRDTIVLRGGSNGIIDPPFDRSKDILDAANHRIGTGSDGKLDTVIVGYAPQGDDRARGQIVATAGSHLDQDTSVNVTADDVVRGSIRPTAGNVLQHATVTAMSGNDILRGMIVEGVDHQLNKATITSGGNNDDHSLVRIECGPDGTLETPVHVNDVVDQNNTILPGADHILNSAANVAATDIIRGTIQEGADNKLDSRPSNANDVVEGAIEEGADNKLDSRPANANDAIFGTVEEGADNNLTSRPRGNDFVTGFIDGGPNGKLNPELNNGTAAIAGFPGNTPATDDEFLVANDVITSGADGICRTIKQTGSDDEAEPLIPDGHGMPHELCVNGDDGDATPYEWNGAGDDFIVTVPDGDDETEGSIGNFNETPNEHGDVIVDVAFHNDWFTGWNNLDESTPPLGAPPGAVWTLNGWPNIAVAPALRADDIDCRGAANNTLRRDLIRESIAHEAGHGVHINHYFISLNAAGNAFIFGGGGPNLHGEPWAGVPTPDNMCSNAGSPVPNTYDATSIQQIRLHLKH